jgi:predicted nuclease with TOPRIM domain
MEKLSFLIIPIALILVLNSCAAVYKCNDQKPLKQPITWSKRLKTVVNERDMLCANLASKVKENDGLKNNLTDLTNKYNELTDQNNNLGTRYKDLQDKYNTLINESLSQTDKFQ